MSNIIGVRNNSTIVPYQSATKRTKEMDFTAAGLITGSGVNASAWVTARATAIAYRDSNSKWRLVFNIAGGPTSTGVRTVYTLTFASTAAVVFKNTAGFYQPVAAALPATNGAVTAYTGVNNGNVTIAHASTDQSLYSIAGDVELESEPTWAAANMEGVTAVDVYIPPASATESGIVTTGAQTIAGVKTFNSGVVLGAGNETLSVYDEGTWTPTLLAGGCSGTAYYTRIGRMVHIFGTISHTSDGSGGTGVTINNVPIVPSQTVWGFARWSGIALDGGDTQASCAISAFSSNMLFGGSPSGSGIDASRWLTGATFSFNITYIV